VRELAPRPLGLADLRLVPRRGKVVETADELVVAESQTLGERQRRRQELTPPDVVLGTPENSLQPRVRRRPFVFGIRVTGHGCDRA